MLDNEPDNPLGRLRQEELRSLRELKTLNGKLMQRLEDSNEQVCALKEQNMGVRDLLSNHYYTYVLLLLFLIIIIISFIAIVVVPFSAGGNSWTGATTQPLSTGRDEAIGGEGAGGETG